MWGTFETGDKVQFSPIVGGAKVTVTRTTHGGNRVHFTCDETGKASWTYSRELTRR
jgi:hypothetical protein